MLLKERFRDKTASVLRKIRYHVQVWVKIQYKIIKEKIQILFERNKLRKDLSQIISTDLDVANLKSHEEASHHATRLRSIILKHAGVLCAEGQPTKIDDLKAEISFLRRHGSLLAPYFKSLRGRRILYAGQSYYNCFYLSRELKKLGWKADVLNFDPSPQTAIYYHGEDYNFTEETPYNISRDIKFFADALYNYDIIHFSNANGIYFGSYCQSWFFENFGRHEEIYLLRKLGKVTTYSNNGCRDGVLQTSFAKWGPESVCSICSWRDQPKVCSDKRNKKWGKFRNKVIDYQCNTGSNKVDYNTAPTIHESPQFYCLDKNIWSPSLKISKKLELPKVKSGVVRVFHAVGNLAHRTDKDGVNIKCSHIYLPLIDKLKSEGVQIELVSPSNVRNLDLRFIQLQTDICLDMLTFGWFGANVREAMMLGKPVICYIRPEWIETIRKEIPDYANELPIISATPDTIEEKLRYLISHPDKRIEIGNKSRDFAVKWHSSANSAKHFQDIYTKLLHGDKLLLKD